MSREIKANLYFLYKETGSIISVFWTIYISSVILFFVLALTLDITVQLSTLMPAVIFTFILGITYIKETLPYVIKLGSTRLGFLIALAIFTIVFALVMTILDFLMSNGINYLVSLFNIEEQMKIATLDQWLVDEYGYLTMFIYTYMLYLILFSASLLSSAILFRFGYIGGGIFIAAIIMPLFIDNVRQEIMNLLSYLVIAHDNFSMGMMIIPTIILFVLIGVIIHNSSAIGKIGKIQ